MPHGSLRTVSLTQPVDCERLVFDGATSQHPEFASEADMAASIMFACPAQSRV